MLYTSQKCQICLLQFWSSFIEFDGKKLPEKYFFSQQLFKRIYWSTYNYDLITIIQLLKKILKMLSMERIADQIGYLVLTEDGAVLTSGGELENDERIANIIINLISLTDKIDPKAFSSNEGFEKISIVYDSHCYVICLSNKKIHVVKKKISPATGSISPQLIDI